MFSERSRRLIWLCAALPGAHASFIAANEKPMDRLAAIEARIGVAVWAWPLSTRAAGNGLIIASTNDFRCVALSNSLMIHAGVPTNWLVGDKTGRGGNGATNDIAILRPPGACADSVDGLFHRFDSFCRRAGCDDSGNGQGCR
jgi:hypothetical protein